MHLFLIIIAVHSLFLGFGFLVGGWLWLVSPDERAIEDEMLEGKVAKEQGWRGIIGFAFERFARRGPPPGVISRTWQNRPVVRKFLAVGCVFLAIAVIAGCYLGVFD